MKNRVLIALAIIFGLAAAASTFLYLSHLKHAYRTSGRFETVVVALTRIPPRTAITASMVGAKEVPVEYIHPGAVTDKKEIIGKITSAEIVSGEPILRERLLLEDQRPEGLAAAVPPGKRAVAVAVDDVSGVAGALVPGDRVDIVGTFEFNGPVSTLFLQGIQVLAVNNPGVPPASGKGAYAEQRTVTLAVTPREAQSLILVTERGNVRMLLRSPKDQSTVSLPVTRLADLIP